mmetsp:Transcript_57859/g.84821  ORF Transcript_57859/g.84821 Transcript_57859/m.84821 type:complete len:215 (-) Transcript_57859:816-1460(-)
MVSAETLSGSLPCASTELATFNHSKSVWYFWQASLHTIGGCFTTSEVCATSLTVTTTLVALLHCTSALRAYTARPVGRPVTLDAQEHEEAPTAGVQAQVAVKDVLAPSISITVPFIDFEPIGVCPPAMSQTSDLPCGVRELRTWKENTVGVVMESSACTRSTIVPVSWSHCPAITTTDLCTTETSTSPPIAPCAEIPHVELVQTAGQEILVVGL